MQPPAERKAARIDRRNFHLLGLRRLAGVLALCLFAAPAGAGEPALLTQHGSRDLPRVALTFDLCQAPDRPAGFDGVLVDILEKENVPATFFAGGDWMRTHPEETRRLAANPFFEIGNHSWSHPDLRVLTPEQIAAEIDLADEMLSRQAGRSTNLFRLPFGWWTADTLSTLAARGKVIIQWDVVAADPDPAVSAADIIETVERNARNGSIIIMHANGRGRHTAEALPQVLAILRKKGLAPVTVSNLLGLPSDPPKP